MTAPAGLCEWCGGPQLWTIVQDEMYVMCKAGCLPLPFEGEVLPSLSGDLESIWMILPRVLEQLGEGGVGPCEGSDAKTSGRSIDELPF